MAAKTLRVDAEIAIAMAMRKEGRKEERKFQEQEEAKAPKMQKCK
jgi:hypothetical protein